MQKVITLVLTDTEELLLILVRFLQVPAIWFIKLYITEASASISTQPLFDSFDNSIFWPHYTQVFFLIQCSQFHLQFCIIKYVTLQQTQRQLHSYRYAFVATPDCLFNPLWLVLLLPMFDIQLIKQVLHLVCILVLIKE